MSMIEYGKLSCLNSNIEHFHIVLCTRCVDPIDCRENNAFKPVPIFIKHNVGLRNSESQIFNLPVACSCEVRDEDFIPCKIRESYYNRFLSARS